MDCHFSDNNEVRLQRLGRNAYQPKDFVLATVATALHIVVICIYIYMIYIYDIYIYMIYIYIYMIYIYIYV